MLNIHRTYEGSTHLYPVNLQWVSGIPKSTRGHGAQVEAFISKLSEPAVSWETF